jgi:glycine/D-amino acid oxidase-like deaminating enzyme/nitrite reductase/ring-hydroxylating ferredoxin subunit
MKYNVSLWEEYKSRTGYPTLERNIETNVVIIGGGISGATCAYMLKKRGVTCVLLEAVAIAGGVTGNTTAKITSQHDLKLHNLIKRSGQNIAKMYAQANEKAIDFIESVVVENNIECNFKRTFACVVTEREDYIKKLEAEYNAAVKLGINADMQLNPEFTALKNAAIEAGLKYYNQAQFNPMVYVQDLVKLFHGGGCRVFENTRAVDITKENGGRYKVATDTGFTVTADYVVAATHFPFYDKRGLYFTKLYPETSYICSFTAKEDFGEGMFKTVEEDGYSLRSYTHNGENIILIAGEYHDTGKGGFTEKNYAALQKKAEALYQVNKFLCKWSAQDYATPDNLPYAGPVCRTMPNVYLMSGYDKWGMTNSTAAAKIISDIITNGESEFAPAYCPQRVFKSFYTLGNYLAKNIKIMATLIGGRLKRLPKRSNIKRSESRLMTINGKRVGIYRDEQGVIHTVQSTCRHMGCQLYFNDAEKTWDCPCHGSRYDIDGRIIEGPATKDLKKYESKDKKSN